LSGCAGQQDRYEGISVVNYQRSINTWDENGHIFEMHVTQGNYSYLYVMKINKESTTCYTKLYSPQTCIYISEDENCDNKDLDFGHGVNQAFEGSDMFFIPKMCYDKAEEFKTKVKQFNSSSVVETVTDRWRAGFTYSFKERVE